MSRRRVAAVVLGLLVVLLPAALVPPAAAAHATVASSDPADGARLATAPSQVSVTFDESVGIGAGYLRVISSTGRDVTTGSATHPNGRGSVVSVGLRAGLGPDTYLVSWLVTSADSHPVDGSIRFVVGSGALRNVTALSVPNTGGPVSWTLDVVRAVDYLGVALLGGAWLLVTVWPEGWRHRRARLLVATGLSGAVLGTVGEVLLQGPYAAAAGFSALGRADVLRLTLQSEFGQLRFLRLVLFVVLGWLLLDAARRPRQPGEPPNAPLLGLIAVATLGSYAATGHARAASPIWLAIPADAVHVGAMATWLGGLALLVFVLLRQATGDEVERVVPIFSRAALVSVVLLAVTGTYQAWRESGTTKALTTTTYGWLVLAKVALFLALVGLGYASRSIVAGRRPSTEPDAEAAGDTAVISRTRLRRTVLVEAALGVVVLAVTGVLVAQPPGRAAASVTGTAGAGTSTGGTAPAARSGRADLGANRSVTVTVDPARSGTTTVRAVITGARPQQLVMTVALAAKDIGPLTVGLRTRPDGSYLAENVLLPSPGRWVFTVVVRLSEFDAVTATVPIQVD